MMREQINFKLSEVLKQLKQRGLTSKVASNILENFLHSDIFGDSITRSLELKAKLNLISTSLKDYSHPHEVLPYFKISTITVALPITTAELHQPRPLIDKTLTSIILTVYIESLEGIVLSFGKYSIPRLQKISWDRPHIFLPITFNALIFSPRPNIDIMRGTVNFVCSDHIQLLIHNTFHAALSLENLKVYPNLHNALALGNVFTLKVQGIATDHDPIMITTVIHENEESSILKKDIPLKRKKSNQSELTRKPPNSNNSTKKEKSNQSEESKRKKTTTSGGIKKKINPTSNVLKRKQKSNLNEFESSKPVKKRKKEPEKEKKKKKIKL